MANIIEHLKNEEFDKVLRFCNEELNKSGDDYNLLVIKGWCLLHLGHIKEAISFVEKGYQSDKIHLFTIKIAQDFFFLLGDDQQIVNVSEYHINRHKEDIDLWYRLALSRALLGLEDQAISDFKHLLTLGDNPKAKANLGYILLNQKKFTEAFPLYESRFEAFPEGNWFNQLNHSIPAWKGESLSGKSILIWSEQGLGDVIQFSRYITVLNQQGANVSFLLQKSRACLFDVIKTVDGLRHLYTIEDEKVNIRESIDYHCPMMSIMRYIDMSDDNIPGDTPYLQALTVDEPKWSFLKENKNFKIGFIWETQTPTDGHDIKAKLGIAKQAKNILLEQLQPLLNIADTETDFYSLQYGIRDENRELLKKNSVQHLGDMIHSFGDTSALMQHMDLIITIDTAAAHLAGALNKPVITLLPYVNDWRWQEGRDDSPWYPSMRLYRQQRLGYWDEVIAKMTEEIRKTIAHWRTTKIIQWHPEVNQTPVLVPNIDDAWTLYQAKKAHEAQPLMEAALKELIKKKCFALKVYQFFFQTEQAEVLIPWCEACLSIDANNSSLWQKLGAAYYYSARHQEAEKAFRESLRLNPRDMITVHSLGLSLMHLGRYKEGLSLHEARMEATPTIFPFNEHSFVIPRWQGEPIAEKSLLVWCEQGFGDNLQFIRFVPMLVEQGAKVSLLLDKRYKKILALLEDTPSIEYLYYDIDNAQEISRQYDFHCPLMSVMHGLSLEPNTLPDVVPYIHSPRINLPFLERLKTPNYKVGIVWSTLVSEGEDDTWSFFNTLRNSKNLTFEELSPLFSVNDIEWVNLKHPLSQQEKKQLAQYNVLDLSESVNSFTDTAAIIELLDLVVSIDTSVVHLSSAMGKPTINMLPYNADWRWQKATDESPWYPSMRLYRQHKAGEWNQVVQDVVVDLNKRILDHK